VPAEILGPFGLGIAAIAVVGVLWREHLRADVDDRAQRDAAMQGWADHTKATELTVAALQALQRDVTAIKEQLRRGK
jgi:hypothetical protein